MKKFRKFNLLFSAVILCSFLFSFSSCSNISSNESESGSVSFGFDNSVFRSISSASKNTTSTQVKSYSITIALSGDSSVSQTVDITNTIESYRENPSSSSLTSLIFPSLPVGSTVTASAKVTADDNIIAEGKSNAIKISRGNNYASISLKFTNGVSPFVKQAEIVLESEPILYLNNALKFSLVDVDTSDTVESYKAEFALYYGGNLVDSKYYTYDSSGNFSQNSTNPLLASGTYQLSVSLLALGYEWASSTFDIEVYNDQFTTPDTQVALYKTDSSYYLIDSSEVANADLSGAIYGSDYSSLLFDAYGYAYSISGNSLVALNGGAGDDKNIDEIQFTIDIVNNVLYGYGTSGSLITLTKYPNILYNGDNNSKETGEISLDEPYNISKVTINNGILYAYGTNGSTDKLELCVYDYSSGAGTKIEHFQLGDYIKNTMGLNYPTVTDIYAMEGAVYLLVKKASYFAESEAWNLEVGGERNVTDIYRLGAVIRYVPPATSGGTGTVSYIGLKQTVAYAYNDITQIYMYQRFFDTSEIFADSEGKTLKGMVGSKAAKLYDSTPLCNEYFPNVYAVSKSDEKYLSCPTKVIGIKPKKLIIADDGVAFYTDADGGLRYKNMNRVITIDLEQFVTENIKLESTNAPFDSEFNNFMRASISLDDIRNGGTYYDYEASIWCRGSDNNYYDKVFSANGSQIFIGIPNGDNN